MATLLLDCLFLVPMDIKALATTLAHHLEGWVDDTS